MRTVWPTTRSTSLVPVLTGCALAQAQDAQDEINVCLSCALDFCVHDQPQPNPRIEAARELRAEILRDLRLGLSRREIAAVRGISLRMVDRARRADRRRQA